MGMVIREVCPRCKSATYKKNGHIHNGKQNHQCKDCGRQFVDCFEQHLVSDETRDLIEPLLLERISLRGICRAVKVGRKWLLGFIVPCCETLPDHLHIQPISCDNDVMIQCLEVETDFGVRIVNPCPASIIEMNVGCGCLRHLSGSPCMSGYRSMLRLTHPTTPWHP